MNIAEHPSKLPVDVQRRSMALCASADAAVLKGDLELARRLLIQADVDDPRNPYPEERIAWLDGEIARFDALKSAGKPEGRMFDFLYAPTLRGGSTELSSLLPLHPGVFSVSKHELDDAIERKNEPGLLAKYQRQALDRHADLRAGLVQHAHIAGQRAGPEVAERLASVTTRGLFLHGVRDPIRLAISDFNHELISRHAGTYVFSAVYPHTMFCSGSYGLDGGVRYKRARTFARRAQYSHRRAIGWRSSGIKRTTADLAFMQGLVRFSLSPDVLKERLADCLTRPRHFSVGQTYAQHFDAWVPIDLERRKSAGENVIGRVFGAIGVDARFDHPALHASEGTTVHRLMVQNWIEVELSGHRLHIGLGYADRSMYSNTFLFSEMLPFAPDERFTALGFTGRGLCVSVRRDQWRLLPRNIRIRLIEGNELKTFRDTVLIPEWLRSYAAWKSIMEKYLLRELKSADLARLRAQIGPDLERFLKRHPAFERTWPSTAARLG